MSRGCRRGRALVHVGDIGEAIRMRNEEHELRQAVVEACRWMNTSGLNQGTSGNISARYGGDMLISPSGVPYDQLEPEDVVAMPLEGEYGSFQAQGDNIPSSE